MLFVCSVAWLFLLGCQYQYKWLTGKTRLRNATGHAFQLPTCTYNLHKKSFVISCLFKFLAWLCFSCCLILSTIVVLTLSICYFDIYVCYMFKKFTYLLNVLMGTLNPAHSVTHCTMYRVVSCEIYTEICDSSRQSLCSLRVSPGQSDVNRQGLGSSSST